ncbi:EpsG family protein [Planococcus sp. 1R117A]|uniref:EpsG family protein n=1 Tax=Planococcus sp. 1R117A TaxID=3447020 RepID=UPI003EDBAC19
MYAYIIIGSLIYMIFLFNLPLLHHKNNGLTHLKIFRFFLLIPIIVYFFFLALFRSLNVGTDYSMYYEVYVNGKYTEHFDFFIILIYEFARQENNFLIFTFIITGLFITFNLLAIKKTCYNFFVSFTFFVLSFYFFYVLNGMRQAVAISILFLGIYYIRKEQFKLKDLLLYILLIFLAKQFHFSAVYMFPLIFLRFIKIDKPIVIVAFIFTAISYFSPFTKDIATSILMNFNFYVQKYVNQPEYFFSVNKEKGIVEFMPVMIQYFFLYYSLTLKQAKSISNRFTLNYYLAFLFLYAGSGIEAIDRLQLYFYPAVILFYDYFIYSIYSNGNGEKRKPLMSMPKTMAIVCVSFWFLYFVIRVAQGTLGINPYEIMS